ncbi:MAG: hypothetical protein ACYC9Y_15060 [Candidatus Methylomirabilia bacterium]
MRNFAFFTAPALIAGMLFAGPGSLWAAAPEPLPQKTFEVRVEGGVVDVTFALALSEVSNYPVTITAINGPLEEVLWDGVLPEGLYRLQAPLTKITMGSLKVVLRTRITNRSAQGSQSYLRYLTWEGTINR